MTLETKRLGRRWYVVGDEDFGPWGPYDTKAEAEADRRGVLHGERHDDEPGFTTIDSFRKDKRR